jgi:hypothetical protein
MELNYYILPGNYQQFDAGLTLHNKIFDRWRSFWTEVLINLPVPSVLNQNDFARQTYIATLLTPPKNIVGFSLHTIFNLNSTADVNHTYFRNNYDPNFCELLKQHNVKLPMTFEYLSIMPEYRNRNIGISLVPILAGLAYRLQKQLAVDASICSCRCDFKVDQFAKMFGGFELAGAGLAHGIKTQNIVTPTNRLKEPTNFQPMLDLIWNNRQFLPGNPAYENSELISAA